MRNLIACLGFNPNNDGIIFPILEARLNDSIGFCRANPGSLLLLMGGYTFRNRTPSSPDPAVLMEKYIADHAPDILRTTDIISQNEASTTMRELCFLRQYIEKEEIDFRLTIVASEFFVERVKLYAEYIFTSPEKMNFIASVIPADNINFRPVEEAKLKHSIEWLKGHTRGDYLTILEEQDHFERKVLNQEIEHPVSQ